MDTDILYGIQEHASHPILDAVFPYFTFLGEAGIMWILIGVCMLFSRKWRFWGICLLSSLACVYLLNELGLKHLMERVRPYIAEGYNTLHFFAPTSYSFPSGHAGCAFAAATVIALSPAKRYWKVLVFIVASLIAYSRLYLFVHYPSDVVVGSLLGILYAIAVVKIALTIREKRQGEGHSGKHATL